MYAGKHPLPELQKIHLFVSIMQHIRCTLETKDKMKGEIEDSESRSDLTGRP